MYPIRMTYEVKGNYMIYFYVKEGALPPHKTDSLVTALYFIRINFQTNTDIKGADIIDEYTGEVLYSLENENADDDDDI